MTKIPSYREMKAPLILFLSDRKEHSLKEAVIHIARRFRVPVKDRAKMLACGKETVLQNRVRWARFELKRMGLVETTRRGYFRWLSN